MIQSLYCGENYGEMEKLRLALATTCRLVHCIDATDFRRKYENVMPEIIFLEHSLFDDIQALIRKMNLSTDQLPGVFILGENVDGEFLVSAVKKGAEGFIPFPVSAEKTIEKIKTYYISKPKSQISLTNEPKILQGIIGESASIVSLKRNLIQYSGNKNSLIILGETGTGKSFFAHILHQLDSMGKNRPFLARNFGAIPPQLFESEIFGSEIGAFTGAVNRPGYFEQANGGTLFLDEIGEIPPYLQAKLLHIVETKTVVRLGGAVSKSIDVRIISATNKSLKKEVEAGLFRPDLFYRLNNLVMRIPPLRERKEDIPLLIDNYFKKNEINKTLNIGRSCLAKLTAYDWPGNIRELESVLARSITLSKGMDELSESSIVFF